MTYKDTEICDFCHDFFHQQMQMSFAEIIESGYFQNGEQIRHVALCPNDYYVPVLSGRSITVAKRKNKFWQSLLHRICRKVFNKIANKIKSFQRLKLSRNKEKR